MYNMAFFSQFVVERLVDCDDNKDWEPYNFKHLFLFYLFAKSKLNNYDFDEGAVQIVAALILNHLNIKIEVQIHILY